MGNYVLNPNQTWIYVIGNVRLSFRLKPKNTVVNVDFWAEILRGFTLVQRATVLINMGRSRHVNSGLAAWITNTSRHSINVSLVTRAPRMTTAERAGYKFWTTVLPKRNRNSVPAPLELYRNYEQPRKSKQRKTQENKNTLVQSPFTTLGQEMMWAYSTTLLSPHCKTNLP